MEFVIFNIKQCTLFLEHIGSKRRSVPGPIPRKRHFLLQANLLVVHSGDLQLGILKDGRSSDDAQLRCAILARANVLEASMEAVAEVHVATQRVVVFGGGVSYFSLTIHVE